jgi:hypothetical protein
MNVRCVLYAPKLDAAMRTRLRIVSYKKTRNNRGTGNVYFVQFAARADADMAARKCRRFGGMTLKEDMSVTKNTTATCEISALRPTSNVVPKVRHVSSHLAPNSLVIRTLLDGLRTCLTVIETAHETANSVRQSDGTFLCGHASSPSCCLCSDISLLDQL